MYRGGWNNLEMLNYYTKKIGMQDSIEQSDLLIDVDKNELEKLKLRVENITEFIIKTAVGASKISKEKEEEIRKDIIEALK